MNHNGKERLDLSRLRAKLREKPRTKAGQVRQAWPDIKALFDAGHSLKDICIWLNEIGIEIGYARLSHYVGQLRRRDEAESGTVIKRTVPSEKPGTHASGVQPPRGAETDANPVTVQQGRSDDPLANIVKRERRSPGFAYNSEPDSKKLM